LSNPRTAACPRCSEPLDGLNATNCGQCNLRLACPSCGSRYLDPQTERFCAFCREPVSQDPWTRDEQESRQEGDSSVTPNASGAPVTSAGRFDFLHRERDRAEAEERTGEPQWRRTRKLFRRVGRQALSIRELYLQLGEALAEAGRFDEASDMFKRALDEAAGSVSEQAEILESLAASLAEAGGGDSSLRADALRAGLEAARRTPDDAARIVGRLRVHDLLDADTLGSEAGWILAEWYPEMSDLGTDTRGRIECELLAARAALNLGDYETAFQLLREAAALEPEVARTDGQHLFASDPLPSNVVESDPGFSHWVRAQAYAALALNEEALEVLELALAEGFRTADADTGSALLLRAELLEAVGRTSDAAAGLLGVGHKHAEQGDFVAAVDLLERAVALDPDAATYWYLADYRRLTANLPDYPYVDESTLSQAREDWDEGRRGGPPTEETAWAYLVSAVINEESARFAAGHAELMARAAADVEQALALDDTSADSWSYLARYHRNLEIGGEALFAAQEAIDIDPENPAAAEELMFIGVQLAVPNALVLIEEHRGALAEFDARIQGLRGYVLALEGEYEASFSELDSSVRRGETNLWVRLYRGLIGDLTGRGTVARPDFEWLNDTSAAGGASASEANRGLYAWATYGLGRYDEAAALFKILVDSPTADAVDVRIGLACADLLLGDLDSATERIDEGLQLVRNRNQALSIRWWLDHALQRLEGEVDAERATKVGLNAREKAIQRAEHEAERVYDDAAVQAELAALRDR
jgi:tetratricopeptide (TPR) repeat protein